MKIYNYIYLITNKSNGKIYIGKHSTDNLDDGYMGSGILIGKAKKKYGIENFTKEYLAFCDTKEKLNCLERFYIKKYKANENGYNLTEGGDGGITWRGLCPSIGKKYFLGKHHSEETKEKIGKALKGKKRKPFSDETHIKMSLSGRGKHNHKGENNPNYKGEKKEKEYIPREIINKHISEAKKGSIPWNKGKEHTKEAKEKMSIAATNRKELHLHWYNNEKEELLASECPFGYMKGRLKK